MQALLYDLGRGRDERVPVDAELLELPEAPDGVRQGRDPVVADVQLHEGEEESDGVRQNLEVVEVLADVEGLKVNQVLEVIGEHAEAVKAGIDDTERGEAGGGVR